MYNFLEQKGKRKSVLFPYRSRSSKFNTFPRLFDQEIASRLKLLSIRKLSPGNRSTFYRFISQNWLSLQFYLEKEDHLPNYRGSMSVRENILITIITPGSFIPFKSPST